MSVYDETYVDGVSGRTLYVLRLTTSTRYYKDEKCSILHREDGPAIEYRNGSLLWLQNDNYHRMDGPSAIDPDGFREWHIDHVPIDKALLTIMLRNL
jgi:hypothetical protein